jgi:hypothetical protein
LNNVLKHPTAGISVKDVLSKIELRDDVKDIYLVCVSQTGELSVYASGDLEHLSSAALLLNNVATNNLLIEAYE